MAIEAEGPLGSPDASFGKVPDEVSGPDDGSLNTENTPPSGIPPVGSGTDTNQRKSIEFGPLVKTPQGLHRPGEAMTGPRWHHVEVYHDRTTGETVVTASKDGDRFIVDPKTWESKSDALSSVDGIDSDGSFIGVGGRGDQATVGSLYRTGPDGEKQRLSWQERDAAGVSGGSRTDRIDVTDRILGLGSKPDGVDDSGSSLPIFRRVDGVPSPNTDVATSDESYTPPSRSNFVDSPESRARVQQDQVRLESMRSTIRHAVKDVPTSAQEAEAQAAIIDAVQAAAGGTISAKDIQGDGTIAPDKVSHVQLEITRNEIRKLYDSGHAEGLPPREVVEKFFADKIAQAEQARHGYLGAREVGRFGAETLVEEQVAQHGVNFEIPSGAPPREYVEARQRAALERLKKRWGIGGTKK